MPLTHSLNILIYKYGVVFKMIAYYAILLLIFVSIAAGILSPIFSEMYAEIQETGVTVQLHQFFDEFLQGDSSLIETFQAIGVAVNSIIDIVVNNNMAVTKGLVVIGVFAILYIYLVSFANLVCSDVVNNFMNSASRFGFLSNLIYNLGKSALYGLLYLVTYLPATACSVAVTYFVGYGLVKGGAFLLAFPACCMTFLVLQSLVLTVFAGWLPAIVVDKKNVAKALVEGPKSILKDHFGYCWMTMFVTMFLCFIFVMISTFFTFGFGFIIAFPTAVVAVKILELVFYFNAHGYKFYETDKKVAEETLPKME